MGSSIHKSLGYGFGVDWTRRDRDNDFFSSTFYNIDLKEQKWRDVDGFDEFLDWSFHNFHRVYHNAFEDFYKKHTSLKSFYYSLKRDIDRNSGKDIRNYDMLDVGRVIDFHSVKSNPKPSILLFTPPQNVGEWTRMDDVMDYSEFAGREDPHMYTEVNTLSICGIKPHKGMVRIEEPDEEIKEKYENTHRMHRWDKTMLLTPDDYFTGVGSGDSSYEPPDFVIKDLTENFRMFLPPLLVCYLFYAALFDDVSKILRKLQPMIVTYWR